LARHVYLAQSDALSAALAGIREHRDHYIKAQGRAAEYVAIRMMQSDGQVKDLNAGSAANFPIYDIVSDQRVASVKCKGLFDGGRLSDSTLNAYIRDFEEAIGRGGDQSKFQAVAQELCNKAKAEASGYPPELAISREKAEDYLRAKAETWLPDDHAKAISEELYRRLTSDDPIEREVAASRLGLDFHSPTYESDMQAMLARIHGLGIKSSEIKSLLDQYFE
jgi:hypothetical protein